MKVLHEVEKDILRPQSVTIFQQRAR